MRTWLTLAVTIMFVAPASMAAAQSEAEVNRGDRIEWHEVKPGETLEGISAQYLGDSKLWPENWRLNPDVKDPHRLTPGQRIRVITRRSDAVAQIEATTRKVEEKPHPDDWTRARVGSPLREKDGVRTYEQSSAQLAFADGSRLQVTERSVIFMRDAALARKATAGSRVLEVVEGQADVQVPTQARRDIVVLVSGTSTISRPKENQAARTRTRRALEGATQVMVFGGASEVTASGKSVQVDSGMGTQVPRGGAPSPPEKLLPAPALSRPDPDVALDHANPQFRWQPVADAASYILEVCLDPDCGQLVMRRTQLDESGWEARGLPMGQYHWRVTAVSASGLDGFPTETRAFKTDSLWRRPHPTPRPAEGENGTTAASTE